MTVSVEKLNEVAARIADLSALPPGVGCVVLVFPAADAGVEGKVTSVSYRSTVTVAVMCKLLRGLLRELVG